MSLQTKVMEALKEAMKAKDTIALESLRAIKSAILLAKTEAGAAEELTEADELKLLQKLVKQRKDSAALYTQQGRNDLAEPELAQKAIIEKFLPAQLSEAEVEATLKTIIAQVGATTAKDMGKVMGVATKQLAGKTDSKLISEIVKKLLS
ncbi:GatB/YqeY domain-containing protein [Capnocytophaga sp. oral taxon 878]|uniref:GatB/YqeY domain-containing protein n=1 Tax=Capnocytophaga sp. oral taxon 878 TaxID=1316596 RepID=UPI000D026FAB|nr:GatB/YqeY domain-containing protein [Capnocytophaga sp. oral taxon 878]AVM51353.1 glutamyl-tRNA amidotransferase [Capnocytophaga sp. oral taxon 878]